MAHAPLQVPLSQLLGACAVELADLAHRCEGLQGALSAGLSLAAVKDAQGLDLVTQSLSALSQYLVSLAAGAPVDWALDPTASAAALPLASLGDRLIAAGDPVEASDDVWLFEAGA